MLVREIQKITDRKRKVILEDGSSFVLYSGEVRKFGISPESDLPQETIDSIRDGVLNHRARARCLNLLKSSDRTEAQLRRCLTMDGYPREVTEDALEYAASYNYINDSRYAENYVRQMAGKKSLREIELKLRE